MTAFTIDELRIPESINTAGARDFIEMTHVHNEIEAATVGNHDLAYTPAELLPQWQDPYEPQRLFVARAGGKIVGRATYDAPPGPNANEVWFDLEVLPGYRRRGIGAALYECLAELAAADDRTVFQADVVHPNVSGPRLPAATGYGSVPRKSAGTRFLLKRGFTLEQVERMSRLPLPIIPEVLASHRDAARLAAGADYRIHEWSGRTPERWLSDLAVLHSRMSTDAPTANLQVSPEVWDEDRLRTIEDTEQFSPRTRFLAVAEHVPTRHLVAFNELSVPPEAERAVEQLDTLVLTEHRGRRLGMLVKAANLAQLQRTHPGHPGVITSNAEENRHMLAVNEQLGFVGVGYRGGWKKTLR